MEPQPTQSESEGSESRTELQQISLKVYEPVLAIKSIEVSGTPVKVTCIECCGSRLFLGTLDGILLEYFISDERTLRHFNQIRYANISNRNQPIIFIRAATAIDSLLVLSGNYLALIDIQTLEIKGNNGIGNVSAVSVDENPTSSDAFVVQLCFSRKNAVVLCQATEKGFNLLREINVDSLAMCLCMESGLICAALANGYYVMINSMIKSSKPMQLCNYDPMDKPRVSHVKKEEFIVLGPGGLGVFVTKNGTSERPPIFWPNKITQMTVHNHLNVVAISEDIIYVHSLIDYQTCHEINLPGVKCLSLSEGNIYVGAARSLYKLNPVSVEQQVEALLITNEIDKAFSLLEISHLKPAEQETLVRRIQQKAIFVHLCSFDYDAAEIAIRESGINLREIVRLFPNLLPLTQEDTGLYDSGDISAITKGSERKYNELACFLLKLLLECDYVKNYEDLSTALLKLAGRYDARRTFQNLLASIHHIPVNISNLCTWMEEKQLHTSLGMLYNSIGNCTKALDIWISILENTLSCAKCDTFPGMELIVNCLVEIQDPNTVWQYFDKIVLIEPAVAIEVFIRKPISSDYPPLQIAERLRKWPNLCIAYLENSIESKDIQDEDCHTYLATLYIDQVLKLIENDADNQEPLNELRTKLKQFLIVSNCLRVKFLIGKLEQSNLRHELAILHGKAGDHRPALLVFTLELKDHKMARDYCSKLRNRDDRRKASFELLKIYLASYSDFEDEESSSNIIALLTDYSEEFDVSEVLPLLPDKWSIEKVSNVLRRAIRKGLHNRRQAKLLAGLTKRVHKDYTMEAYNGNHGYILDTDSICEICHKSFDLTDPIHHINGFVVHEKCQ